MRAHDGDGERDAGGAAHARRQGRFYTNAVKLPLRDPLLTAKQIATMAVMISPAPDRPVPIYVGGHSEPGLRRADRGGYRALADIGVTECRVSPRHLYGADFASRTARLDAVRRFADEIIARA